MIIISENRENLCISFTKGEVEHLHILTETLLELDFSGDENASKMEKLVDKLYDELDKFLERNGKPSDCLIP